MSMKVSIFTLLSCSLFIFNPQPFSNAQSKTLTPGQSITDGQTLVSAANIFVLGFFSPGNSTSRYVGIWYQNITQTIVWVANRQFPITGRSGSITLTSTGSLAVIDGAGQTIWSTNSPPTPNSTATAFLMNSGNLVIRRADKKITWKSFDYPTDTFIPGHDDDSQPENRQQSATHLMEEPKRSIHWELLARPRPEWLRSDIHLGWGEGTVAIWAVERETFIGTMMRPLYLYGFKLVSDVNKGIMYFTFGAFNTSMLRFQLDSNGIEDTTMSVGDGWESVWVQPGNECEFYGKCGRYGVCAYDGDKAKCSCLKGSEMSTNSTAGCARTIPLQCRSSTNGSSGVEGDGFFQVAAVKLPDLSNWETTVASEADCRTACLNNCSCEAYAYPTNIGCLIWSGELIDIYEFPQGGSVLYLKLPASELGSPKRTWKIIVITSTIGAAIFIVCFFLLWKYSGRIKNWSRKRESLSTILRFSQEVKPAFSGPNEGGEEGRREGTSSELPFHSLSQLSTATNKFADSSSELPFYSLSQLSTATNKFADSNKLGQGGFGHVYQGLLPGGQEIAVKRLSAGSGQGHDEFKNEVILIARLQHRNLVRLLGCCIEREEKILVYEYMPNKSLDAFLFEPQKQALLDWTIRFRIIEGIVRGLLYLHRDSRLRIVHRDLKASNILLDEHMNPKISDFGMAKIFGGDENQANTNRMAGTYGYMSPEYAMEGLFSVKSDVYSFGVLVLEIVIGRRNSSFHLMESSLNIVGYAWRFWRAGKAEELIDESIRDSCSIDQVLRCIQIALLCVQDHVNDRPDMANVVLMLVSETATLPAPEQPMFASVTEGPSKMAASNKNETFSVNDMSITVAEGR